MSDIVKVKDLTVKYFSFGEYISALDDVSFDVTKGEILGIVGESGAGKSTIGWALLGLIDPPSEMTGEILYEGDVNLTKLSAWKLENFRWKKVAMVFQTAMNGFDPLQTIGKSFAQILIEKNVAKTKQQAFERIRELFSQLGLSPEVLSMFPHELSGGMKQRVSIAMAISCNPALLIADEATTALDVVAQFSVINILKNLVLTGQISTLIFITHDISVQLLMVDRLMVMLGGHIIEEGSKEEVSRNPLHPYTKYLFSTLRASEDGSEQFKLKDSNYTFKRGDPGCPFEPRCPFANDRCKTSFPSPNTVSGTHKVFCYIYEGQSNVGGI